MNNTTFAAIVAGGLGFCVGGGLSEHLTSKAVCESVCDTEYSWFDGSECICAARKMVPSS